MIDHRSGVRIQDTENRETPFSRRHGFSDKIFFRHPGRKAIVMESEKSGKGVGVVNYEGR